MSEFNITYYEYRTRHQGGPVRFVFLSDLHNKKLGRDYDTLRQAIDEAKPDAILIGGDQIVAKPGYSMDPGLKLAALLAEQYPVYYAPGNHEYRLKLYPDQYLGMYEEFRRRLRDTKITYLEGQTVRCSINGMTIRLMGYAMSREFYNRYYRGPLELSDIVDQVGEVNPEEFTILLAHHPGYHKEYEAFGADLTLSGHFHGGVVGLGPHRGLVTPNFRMFNPYCRGRFDSPNGQCHIVSAGIGEHTIPFRIHNPRELIIIDVKGEETDGDSGKIERV